MKANSLYKAAACLIGLCMFVNPVFAQSLSADTSVSGLFNAIKSEVDASRMEVLLKTLLRQPDQGNKQILADVSTQMTAVAYAEAGNIEKASYWIGQIKDLSMQGSSRAAVVTIWINADKLAAAEQMIEAAANREQLLSQLGIIRFKQGKYQEALPYLKKQGMGSSEYYILALMRLGNDDLAFTESNQLLRNSAHISAELKSGIKAIFVKKYGNEQRFNFLIDSLKAAENKKMLTKITRMEVNEQAPDFELKDLNGKTVSLKSLRGKIVILDFWATWCQPCVASFPGMQKAVDYFKDDKDVVFMFIHTMEKSSTADEDARRMLAAKKNRFDVYMDWKDKATGKSPVCAAYRISGIPAKFFIDRNGVIRYKNSGYIGVEEAIPEIKMIVDKIRG
ncbi:peroxiredoxin [Pedobacter africanus]|uniref:Peroxiredoxin n=1 Tax=Pedobacter africanus TaxID=151894 RepID=A0ACC6KQ62_9SPHI|nr:TlpA disulfide reductase family protein [Pedobacter africanus]MDR6781483.1 peroxiredoxin [Pedobacter africanus]